MPARKSTKKRGGSLKRKTSAVARKTAKASAKVASTLKKRAVKVASNPRRTVGKAADNVQQTASRARAMGDSVVTAGELIKETADFVDSMAARAKSRVRKAGSQTRNRR